MAGSSVRVLVVEDEPRYALLLCRVLGARPGFETLTAATLSDALAVLRDRPVDAVVLDLGLPDSRGLSTLKSVRDAAPGAAVVIVTARDDEHEVFEALDGGAQEYLVKGPGVEKLIAAAVLHGIRRKRTDDALVRGEEALRALAGRLATVREEERTEMSRQIHDELGHLLAAAKMDVVWLQKRFTPGGASDEEAARSRLDEAADLLDQAVASVRDMATRLRPGILDHLGVAAAIEWAAEGFARRTGIECVMTGTECGGYPGPSESTALFRVFEEVLTNVALHSAATRVNVRLRHNGNTLVLHVRDNGNGIPKKRIYDPRSLGLLGMRERLRSVGGAIRIRGRPGSGTSVVARIPMNGCGEPAG